MTTRLRDPRRFLRFGLRSLLALVALAAVAAWLYRQLVVTQRDQREFLAVAKKLGATVTVHLWRSGRTVPWTEELEMGWMDRIIEVDFCGDGFWRFEKGEPIEALGLPLGAEFDYRRFTNKLSPRPDVGLPEKERLQATHDCLRRLSALHSVERLSLADWAVEEESLKLVGGLRLVEQLELRGNELPHGTLGHLSGMTQLKHLGLSSTGVSDQDLAQLPELPNLETLDLSDTPISDAAVEALRRPALKRLYLSYCQRLEGARITDLPRLEHLDLGGTNLRVLRVEDVPALRSLNLTRTFLAPESLVGLRGAKQLQRIGLSGTPMTGRGLAELRDLPHLEELCIDATSLDDTGLEHLKAFPSLKNLLLIYIGVSGEDVREQKAREALPAEVQIKSSQDATPGGNWTGGWF